MSIYIPPANSGSAGLIRTVFTSLSVDSSVTGASWVDLLSQDFNKIQDSSSSLVIQVSFSGYSNAVGVLAGFRLLVDGTIRAGSALYSGKNPLVTGGAIVQKITGLSSGSHTIKIQWTAGGATTLYVRPISMAGFEHLNIFSEEVVV